MVIRTGCQKKSRIESGRTTDLKVLITVRTHTHSMCVCVCVIYVYIHIYVIYIYICVCVLFEIYFENYPYTAKCDVVHSAGIIFKINSKISLQRNSKEGTFSTIGYHRSQTLISNTEINY
jgi:hypothetical protein